MPGAPIDFKLLATSALAFACALSWNNAVEATVRSLYPADQTRSAKVMAAYALVVTLLVIVIVVCLNCLSRAAERLRQKSFDAGAIAGAFDSAGVQRVLESATQGTGGSGRVVNINWPSHW